MTPINKSIIEKSEMFKSPQFTDQDKDILYLSNKSPQNLSSTSLK